MSPVLLFSIIYLYFTRLVTKYRRFNLILLVKWSVFTKNQNGNKIFIFQLVYLNRISLNTSKNVIKLLKFDKI